MATTAGQSNPYIAGRALGQQRGFFGRTDILNFVETRLRTPDESALVLFGQRRIGKTSILLQLCHRLPSPPFLPIYFDLMDRARLPLGQVLCAIASTIAAEADLAPPEPTQFDDHGIYFRHTFLPALYAALGEERIPVLFLDEFDVLDVAAEEHLRPTDAAQAFFPYLRALLEGEPRLKFVFVVGRRAEDLSINVKATFKTSLYQRVSVLDDASARELITTAERQGALVFDPAAIERILTLTAGHPYFVQLLCQILWDNATAIGLPDASQIRVEAIDIAAAKALNAGHNIFEWIWDGLPPAERIIFAAIAAATEEQTVVTEEDLTQLLQSQGVRILTRELELAPRTLIEWEMLRETTNGYQFFIELMRRWVVLHKPLPKVKEELDKVIPLADMLYRTSDGFYRQRDLINAQNLLHQTLRVNPNHLKGRLLLGQILLEQGQLEDAVRELEEAYRYDETAAHYPLIRVLLARGEELERVGKDDSALTIYKRVIEISPNEKVAQEHCASIWITRGDAAIRSDDLETALNAYQQAGIQEKIDYVKSVRQKRDLEHGAAEAQYYEQRGSWAKAIEIYQRLMTYEPVEERWHELLAQAKMEQRLNQQHMEAMKVYSNGDWGQAMRAFADVVYIRPDYKEAASLLAEVVALYKAQQSVDLRVKAEKPTLVSAKTHNFVIKDPTSLEFLDALISNFIESEIDDIYGLMGIGYENISGLSKEAKAERLVLYCIRNSLNTQLLAACNRLHKNFIRNIGLLSQKFKKVQG